MLPTLSAIPWLVRGQACEAKEYQILKVIAQAANMGILMLTPGLFACWRTELHLAAVIWQTQTRMVQIETEIPDRLPGDMVRVLPRRCFLLQRSGAHEQSGPLAGNERT